MEVACSAEKGVEVEQHLASEEREAVRSPDGPQRRTLQAAEPAQRQTRLPSRYILFFSRGPLSFARWDFPSELRDASTRL